MRIALVLAGLMMLPAQLAFAGRPLNTDDAATVAVGELEVEVSYDFVDIADSEHIFTSVFTTGLFENIDVGVAVPYQYIDIKNGADEDGLSDINITTKWYFLRDNPDLFDATLSFSYKSDTGEEVRSLGTGTNEYTILGIITKEVAPLTIHLNLGPSIIESSDELLNYLLAAEWPLTDRVVLVGEVFGTNDLEGSFDDNSLSALLGVTHQFNDNTVLDAGVSWGISDADADWSMTTGVTIAL